MPKRVNPNHVIFVRPMRAYVISADVGESGMSIAGDL
jgi:hypothetical protein